MKKFTKIMLIVAVVLIIVGMGLFAGGILAGGKVDGLRAVIKTEEFNREVGMDALLETTENTWSADGIRGLDLEAGASEIELIEDVNGSTVSVVADRGNVTTEQKNGTLVVKTKKDSDYGKITVVVPKDFSFREVDISAGGSNILIEKISADSLDVEIGAGRVEIQKMNVTEAEFDIGAGEIIVNGNAVECSASIGMGNFSFDGAIERECDIECGMGNAELFLEGAEEDYNYEIECSAGNVTIGSENYSGLGTEKTINHDASAAMDIECSMGNVTVEF